MSDFNPLDRAKIPTHRSSFDLSSKKLFTAKVGEKSGVTVQRRNHNTP
jgi:hypothetical protein